MELVYQDKAKTRPAIEIAGKVRIVPLDTHNYRETGTITGRALLYWITPKTFKYVLKEGREPSPAHEKAEPFQAYPALELEYFRQRRAVANGSADVQFSTLAQLLTNPDYVLLDGSEMPSWDYDEQLLNDATGDKLPYDLTGLLPTIHRETLEALLDWASGGFPPEETLEHIHEGMKETGITEDRIADAAEVLFSFWEQVQRDVDELNVKKMDWLKIVA